MKIICELTNPSDAITFVVSDPKVAGVAILLLGNGWYGLTDKDGNSIVPLMMFGAHEKWLKDNGITDTNAFIMANAVLMAEFLETVAYGSIAEREALDIAVTRMTPENAAAHREWWNDRKRSSLNNIGAAALKMAKGFRKIAAGQKAELKASPPIVLSAP